MDYPVKHHGKTYQVHVCRMYDDRQIASVWEQTGSLLNGESHSTITTISGIWHGELGTRPLPEWIDRIPGLGHETLDERIRLCRRYRSQQSRIAQEVLGQWVRETAGISDMWQYNADACEAVAM